jgi:hypothetical protein
LHADLLQTLPATRWEAREETDGSLVALEQQLGDSRRGAEVAADRIARIERIHVRHVALARCGFFEVDGPFLELTVPSDLVGDETHDGRVELWAEIGVDAQFLSGGGIGGGLLPAADDRRV